jgi:hypothetical protein
MAWRGYHDGGSDAAIERVSGAKERITNEPSKTYFTDYDEAKRASKKAAIDAA